MRRVRSVDTVPERRLRSLLWREGLRFRKHYKVAGVRIDIAFLGHRIAVMVDGCFWHGCPQHYRRPKSRHDYWDAKLVRNQMRDDRNDRSLASAGWTVVRVWEHEPQRQAVGRVLEALDQRQLRSTSNAPVLDHPLEAELPVIASGVNLAQYRIRIQQQQSQSERQGLAERHCPPE